MKHNMIMSKTFRFCKLYTSKVPYIVFTVGRSFRLIVKVLFLRNLTNVSQNILILSNLWCINIDSKAACLSSFLLRSMPVFSYLMSSFHLAKTHSANFRKFMVSISSLVHPDFSDILASKILCTITIHFFVSFSLLCNNKEFIRHYYMLCSLLFGMYFWFLLVYLHTGDESMFYYPAKLYVKIVTETKHKCLSESHLHIRQKIFGSPQQCSH